MIPGPLCALQRAELPESRVARGGPWCRRVQVLQQVLPTLRLATSVRGAQLGCPSVSFVGRLRALAVGPAVPAHGIGGGPSPPNAHIVPDLTEYPSGGGGADGPLASAQRQLV